MKFGKYIRSVAYAPWADKYVDYKLLKKHLKPFEEGVATQECEDVFLMGLQAEIDKVGSARARVRACARACAPPPARSQSGLPCCTGSDEGMRAFFPYTCPYIR